MLRTRGFLGFLLAASLLTAAAGAAGIQGTVRAGDSTTAVSGADVVLSRPGTGGGARTPVDTVQTDAEGKFEFTGVAAGDNYGVAVAAAGFRAYTNNNVDLAADTTVAVLAITLAAIPPPAAISGTVVGADSTSPLAGATVVLTGTATGGGFGRAPLDTLQTDAQGRFSFPALAAAQNYGLTVTATGFQAYTNNNIDLAGRDTSLTIRLAPIPPPAAISGTVVGADSTTAVANATVVLTRSGTGGGGARTPVDTVQTDAQGKFSFPALAAAQNYGLTVTATGFQTYTNNNIDLAGRDTSLTIRIVPPPAPGAINGTVFAADSTTAVANATVILNRPGGSGAGGIRVPMDTVKTDAQGKFAFAGVAAGDNYGLVVTATGFQPYTNNNVDLDGGDTATVNVRLAPPGPPGTIAGTVRGPAGPNAAPVANAAVVLRSPLAAGGLPLDTVQTNAQGQFTFPSVPSMDNYVLTVTAAGFNTANNNNVDVDSSDTATVNFTLTTVASVFRISRGHDLRMTWTDDALTIRFPALAGPAVLTAYGPDGATLFRAPVPAAGGPVRLPGRATRPGGALVLSGGGKSQVLRLPRR